MLKTQAFQIAKIRVPVKRAKTLDPEKVGQIAERILEEGQRTPILVRADGEYSAAELRRLAKVSKDVNQSRRLLSLAAVLDGMSREDAARVGGMDRQTLRDWMRRFNETGPDGLRDAWHGGPEPRLSPAQKAELAQIVDGAGPAVDGVVRWRRIDLQKVISARFGVGYQERYVGTLLKEFGFSHECAATPSGAGRRDRRGI